VPSLWSENCSRSGGYRVLEVEDGVSGLEMLRSDAKVDLRVSDTRMPSGLNGRQMLDAIRSRRLELRTLFITTYAEDTVLGREGLDRASTSCSSCSGSRRWWSVCRNSSTGGEKPEGLRFAQLGEHRPTKFSRQPTFQPGVVHGWMSDVLQRD
jgi:CheY-like chemotaxis protein